MTLLFFYNSVTVSDYDCTILREYYSGSNNEKNCVNRLVICPKWDVRDRGTHALKPKSLRFLAAPKPPGKTIAATSEEALRVAIDWTASLAILRYNSEVS